MFGQMIRKMLIEASVAGFLGYLFGGPAGGVAAFNAVLRLPGRKEGGPVSASEPYIVGERGPELFMPKVSGEILPKIPEILKFALPEMPELKAPKIMMPELLKFALPEIPEPKGMSSRINIANTPSPVQKSSVTKTYAYNDNTTLTLNITGDVSKPEDIQKITVAVDRMIRERKSKEFENFRRKIANG